MQDRFGQDITCISGRAASAYVEAVDLMLTAWPGADFLLEKALADDPGFALAHAARARVLQMQAKPVEAQAAIAIAQKLYPSLTSRERSHIHTLSLAIEGGGAGALESMRSHVADWPRDGLILSLITGVYGLMGFSGIADHHEQQRDLLDSLAPHWGDDWWFVAFRGWAHAETGNAVFGMPLLEHSLQQRRANANAAHGRAHAHYELGETAPGASFLETWLPAYVEKAPLYPHLSWHLSLFALREGDTERARAIYSERLDPARSRQPPFFAIVDAGAFNWRCLLRGQARPENSLESLSAFASEKFPQGGIGFANVHIAYAHAAAGNQLALEKHLGITKGNAENNIHPSAHAVHSICLGIQGFSDSDFAAAARHLENALPELPRIGGSHAQRDAVWETLVAACLRAGREERAVDLLEQRLGLKAIFKSW